MNLFKSFFKNNSQSNIYSLANTKVRSLKTDENSLFYNLTEDEFSLAFETSASENKIEILSPVEGVLKTIFPHQNGFIIETQAGFKILIYFDLKMDFEIVLSKSLFNKVKQGEKLCEINLKDAQDLFAYFLVVLPESGKCKVNKLDFDQKNDQNPIYQVIKV
ncbi:hypothetical protein [Mycoplasmopsis glycophila]|uniref:PTS EIIA type-1 domain-containing protein n=1 Tax=Mycoplasmopsis glycophila TaxID=171285 RepID=A0A449AW31_9BACT|nr:hypothetical protein [Mycoplasmopsis glycophila]VEU70823.1 Uncharacterised protein [Mycoplasmopsis glycophila]